MGDILTDKFRHLHFDLCGAAETQALFTGFDHRLPYRGKIMSQDHRSPGIDIVDIGVAIRIVYITSVRVIDKSGSLPDGPVGSYRTVDSSGYSFYRALK